MFRVVLLLQTERLSQYVCLLQPYSDSCVRRYPGGSSVPGRDCGQADTGEDRRQATDQGASGQEPADKH